MKKIKMSEWNERDQDDGVEGGTELNKDEDRSCVRSLCEELCCGGSEMKEMWVWHHFAASPLSVVDRCVATPCRNRNRNTRLRVRANADPRRTKEQLHSHLSCPRPLLSSQQKRSRKEKEKRDGDPCQRQPTQGRCPFCQRSESHLRRESHAPSLPLCAPRPAAPSLTQTKKKKPNHKRTKRTKRKGGETGCAIFVNDASSKHWVAKRSHQEFFQFCQHVRHPFGFFFFSFSNAQKKKKKKTQLNDSIINGEIACPAAPLDADTEKAFLSGLQTHLPPLAPD